MASVGWGVRLMLAAFGVAAAAELLCIQPVAVPLEKGVRPFDRSSWERRVEATVELQGRWYEVFADPKRHGIVIGEVGQAQSHHVLVPSAPGKHITALATGPGGWLWVSTREHSHLATITLVDGKPALVDSRLATDLYRHRCTWLYRLSLFGCERDWGYFSPTVRQLFFSGYRKHLFGLVPLETHVEGPGVSRRLAIAMPVAHVPFELPQLGGVLLLADDGRPYFYDGKALTLVIADKHPFSINRWDQVEPTWDWQTTRSGRVLLTNLRQATQASDVFLVELLPGGRTRRFTGLPRPGTSPRYRLADLADGLLLVTKTEIYFAADSNFRLVATVGSGMQFGQTEESPYPDTVGTTLIGPPLAWTKTALALTTTPGPHCLPVDPQSQVVRLR